MLIANCLLTAGQVKEYLSIPAFWHLTIGKPIEFVSVISDLNKEVAIKTIEQFPEFNGYSINI